MSVRIFQRVSAIQERGNLSFWISATVLLMACAIQTPHAVAQGSAITPSHIFNAGYNLGLLIEASGAGVQAGTYGVWAANTTAEWTASWTPIPAGYAASPLSGPYPLQAVIHYQKQLELMMTYSTLCKDPLLKASPWAKHAIKVFRAGYNFGRVNVLTALDCPECLKSPLFAVGLDLQDTGLETKNTIITENGIILKTLANGIKLTGSRAEDIATLQALRGLILISFNIVGTEMPLVPQPCGAIPDATPTPASSAPDASPLGVWHSSYGDIDFKAEADGTLRSTYGSNNARLLVRFDGSVFEGIWAKDYPRPYCSTTRDGSSYWGRVRFEYDAKKDKYVGKWGYCENEMDRDWSMWR